MQCFFGKTSAPLWGAVVPSAFLGLISALMRSDDSTLAGFGEISFLCSPWVVGLPVIGLMVGWSCGMAGVGMESWRAYAWYFVSVASLAIVSGTSLTVAKPEVLAIMTADASRERWNQLLVFVLLALIPMCAAGVVCLNWSLLHSGMKMLRRGFWDLLGSTFFLILSWYLLSLFLARTGFLSSLRRYDLADMIRISSMWCIEYVMASLAFILCMHLVNRRARSCISPECHPGG